MRSGAFRRFSRKLAGSERGLFWLWVLIAWEAVVCFSCGGRVEHGGWTAAATPPPAAPAENAGDGGVAAPLLPPSGLTTALETAAPQACRTSAGCASSCCAFGPHVTFTCQDAVGAGTAYACVCEDDSECARGETCQPVEASPLWVCWRAP